MKDDLYRTVASREDMILAVKTGGEDEANYNRLIDLIRKIKSKTMLKPRLIFSSLAGLTYQPMSLTYQPMIEARVKSLMGQRTTSIRTIARLWNVWDMKEVRTQKNDRRIESLTVHNADFTATIKADSMTMTITLKASCPIEVFHWEDKEIIGGKL